MKSHVMDLRRTPANERVAERALQGHVHAARYVDAESPPAQSITPTADILNAAGGDRVSQLLYGDLFNIYERLDGYAFGQARHDGYCGYIDETSLEVAVEATYWVAVPATHRYARPDIKGAMLGTLYLGTQVRAEAVDVMWYRLADGSYIRSPHLKALGTYMASPLKAAELYLGTPYLWGGTSRAGLDCSGLIQSAYRCCGRHIPRDSDMQESEVGQDVPQDKIQSGDLVFWKGHVAIARNAHSILHANAHTMSVSYEPLTDAIERIKAEGGGPVTSVKRL